MRLRLAIALASALVLAPSVARPQTGDPKRAFEEAVEIEKRGEYEAALDRFRKIEAQKSTAGVLFHIGYCLENLGKLAPAYDAYERAEKLARETNKPEVVTAVHSRLDPLAKRVPLVNVTVEPKEAQIRIDGQPVTNMSVRVEAGEHDLVADAPGYAPKKLRLQCPPGSVQSLALRLEPGSANAPAAATAAASTPAAPHPSSSPNAPAPFTEPPREEPPRGSIALPLAVTGGAIVFLAGGVVSFLLAGSAQSDAKDICPTKTSCEDERSEVRTLDTLALTGFIAGAGLGALAVILWTGRSSGSAKVTASGSSLVLRGEF
jgi:hypothetical protein